jgi:type VI secretion system protein ImpH
MAPQTGRARADLSQRLLHEPQRFDFFQAVRLLEWVVRERHAHGERRPVLPVGGDVPPEQELVHFRALPALGFPPSAISGARLPESADEPAEMTVAFLGLTGPAGVLPEHYTTLLLQRLRQRDTTLRDFLDVFHHRLVSLFYRAWEKYRLPFLHERRRLDSAGGDDPPAWALYCLASLGTDKLRGRLEIDDETFLYYSGHFAHWPRSAVALQALLEDYFEMPLRVEQLHGQWLHLGADDQAVLPRPDLPQGRYNRLGFDLMVGERVWEVQSKFRLRVGPLTFAQFCRLMPCGDGLRPLCQLTRAFVGPEFDFDVQAVLLPAEVPWCRMSSDGDGAYLGWNTWVRSDAFTRPVEDAVFSMETLSGAPGAPRGTARHAGAT